MLSKSLRSFSPSLCVLILAFVARAVLAQGPGGASDTTTRIVTLGTAGGPFARVERAQPANALVVKGKPYLIDSGNGVLRQLVAAGLSPLAVDTIFITHHHDDHNADVGTLMGSSWDRGRKTPINVYGPPGTVETITGFLSFFQRNAAIRNSDVPRPDPRTIFVGHDILTSGLAFQDENVTVTAAENTHFAGFKPGTPAFGKDKSFAYRFDTKDRSIVFTGDTGPSDAVAKLAEGADVLVSEVIDPKGMARLLRKFYANETDEQRAQHLRHFLEDHLTPQEVGKMAATARVKMVVLTHLVPGEDGERDDDAYSGGVKEFFKGSVVVAKDLMSF
jgi:ribonuclease BN (tRNA processing enzyme)